MLLTDINVLVYAYREDTSEHTRFRSWLQDLVNGHEAFGLADIVCSGFLRVVTHPAVFSPASPMQDALAFLEEVRRQPGCVVIAPGSRHWSIFVDLCRRYRLRGNLVSDAYLAALAIESGSEWISTDGDFGRFTGLRWRRPF